MARLLFALVGALLAIAPAPVVDGFETFAITNRQEVERKPFYLHAARLEGITILMVTIAGGNAYQQFVKLLGVGGVVAALFPIQIIRFNSQLTYQNPQDIQWHPRYPRIVRVIGIIYVILAIRASRQRVSNRHD